MKTISSLFFVFVLSCAHAQILIGPVAGAQYSWTSFDDKDNKDLYKVKPVAGFHAGAMVSFLVRKRFYLHTSFLYSIKGKEIEGKQDALLSNKVRFHYIDVPILYTVDFKAKINKTKEFKYYLGLGPNISYWLGGKGKFYNTDLQENVNTSQSYRVVFDKQPEDTQAGEMTVADPNRIQLGLNLAAGAVFEPFGQQRFMLTLRYEFGHSFFSRTSNGVFADTYYQDVLRSRNQGFRLSLAYQVDLKVQERKRGKSTIRKKNL